MHDPETRAHLEWLGYVQQVGLVVSVPALVAAGAAVNRNIAPEHQGFLACLPRDPRGDFIPELRDFPAFTRDVLRWEPGDLLGGPDAEPVPTSLEVVLPSYHETLRPTFAVREFVPATASPRTGAEPPAPWILLIQQLPAGTDFDAITAEDRHWQASPQARFERLLRETQVPAGLLLNGQALRLVHAPRGESSGHITFRVHDMTQVAGRPIFAALHMLLEAPRLFTLPDNQRLPALLANSRKYQNVVSTQLAQQVLAALYELVRGFQAADDQRRGDLLRDVLAENPDHVYAGLLTVLMRLVFLLYAEDRGLLSSDSVYTNHYSVTGLFDRLRADAGRYTDTMDQRCGGWAQLLTLFRLIYDGGGHGGLRIPPRRGYLFDPDRYNFLEGRPWKTARRHCDGRTEVPRVSDGVLFRVLSNLLLLDGERLSYRTLDVEQIGSVYETMMGFHLEPAGGPSIAIRPKKSHGAPTSINLAALLAEKPSDRAKWLKAQSDQEVTGQAATALKEAATTDDLLAALERKIHKDATPNVVPGGAMVLQPSDERRRSGSHYTPRSLTEPIVRTTLRPVLEQLGDNPKPEQILDLKVCDPAMGSGAFLVESCRQLGDVLIKSWHAHGCVPKLPPDEDEVLHARRLIAQRCLYGVDRNPMAVDLAKLSLWLATLAKDHPFTFLDHALKHGDSLVGLTREQIEAFHWDPPAKKKGGPWFGDPIEAAVRRVTEYRRQILASRDDVPYEQLRQQLDLADEALSLVRLAGDLVIAAYFAESKDRDREKRLDESAKKFVAYLEGSRIEDRRPLAAAIEALRAGDRPIMPFHWPVEFPEVFLSPTGGFDAIVGNPPFAGKNTLINGNRDGYLDWLKTLHDKSHGNADLVAHFYRRAFNLLRPIDSRQSTNGKAGGCFGLIATNTIGQGDTRSTGLRSICTHGGTIYAARKRLKWPGEAAVVVSVVHVMKGRHSGPYLLDGREVLIITAYLFHAGGHDDPESLMANASKSFIGSYLLGMGFTFDDSDRTGSASPISLMHELISREPRNAERIFPYIGGEEVNDSPTHTPSRYVINFVDWPLKRTEMRRNWAEADPSFRDECLRSGVVPRDYPQPVASDYPDLLAILESRVRPERERQNDEYGRRRWWNFLRPRPELHEAIKGLGRILLCARIGNAFAFTFLPAGIVLNEKIVVFPFQQSTPFGVIQSRVHEVWARFFSSTLKDDMQYTPSGCFETFPFPIGLLEHTSDDDSRLSIPDSLLPLETAGHEYYDFRAALMVRNDEGLTKTYNRFHDPDERSADILKLRELHAAMDRAVLEAYGWHDLADRSTCEFLLDYEDDEEEIGDGSWGVGGNPSSPSSHPPTPNSPARRKKKPWRYRWPDEFRDEVLARLLALNQERALQERLAGEAAAPETGGKGSGKKKGKPAASKPRKKKSPNPELFNEE